MDEVPHVDKLTEQLISVWTTALHAPATADSDFFALGGDSVSVIAIATALGERYEHFEGIELAAVQTTFESPSLRTAAESLRAFMLAAPSRRR